MNDALKIGEERYDVSPGRMFKVLQIIGEDIEKIEILCKEFEREMPSEMKLIFDVKSGKFQAEYKYDLIHTIDDLKTADDIADEWFEEIKNNNL